MNSDGFLKIVRRYTEIEELTLEILHEFIDKIVIHHREDIADIKHQKIEIHYKMIGHITLPKMSKTEMESYLKVFGQNEKTRLLTAI